MTTFQILFSPEVFASTLRIMIPLMFVSLGGLIVARSGIENIGLEGLMLIGCFSGLVFNYYTESWIWGLVGSMICTMVAALLFGLFVITFKAHEIVAGVAINILGLGLTTYLLRVIFGVKGSFSDPRIVSIPTVKFDFLDGNDTLSTIFSGQSILLWIVILLAVFIHLFLYKTRFGSYIRAAGENPNALASAGVNVTKVRYVSVLMHGALCALGGAYLSMGYLTQYVENMTAGRGFIAIAAIAFARAIPSRVIFSVLLFAFVESIANRLQSVNVPSYFALMLPYIITIIVLAITSFRKKKKGGNSLL